MDRTQAPRSLRIDFADCSSASWFIDEIAFVQTFRGPRPWQTSITRDSAKGATLGKNDLTLIEFATPGAHAMTLLPAAAPLPTGRALSQRMRRGAAAVELAICLPVMVTLVMGSIECANVIFLKQSLTAAAYEAAQVVTTDGATTEDARTRANSVLTTFGVRSANVVIVPEVTPMTPAGTRVRVTVTAPIRQNSTLLRFFEAAGTSTASVTMVRL
jgi:hypothetical protein